MFETDNFKISEIVKMSAYIFTNIFCDENFASLQKK